MPATKNVPETIQQAHDRIRRAAIVHFSHRPHTPNDRLEWIKKQMCEVRGTTYKPPKPPPPPVAMERPADGASLDGVLTSTPDTDEEM